METSPLNLLLVGNNQRTALDLKGLLDQTLSPLDISFAEGVEAGLKALSLEKFEAILVDLSGSSEHALAWIAALAERAERVPLLLLTDAQDDSLAIQALRAGVQDYLIRVDLNGDALLRAIQFAIARKTAVNDSRDMRQSLQRYTERLRILRSIDEAILAARSPETIAKETLRHIRNLVPCDQASIAIFDAESRQVTVFATFSDERIRRGTGTLLSFESFGDLEVLQQGWARVVGDIRAIPNPPLGIRDLLGEGVLAYLRVPLVSKKELIGALTLEAYTANVFTEEHGAIAQEVADPLAIAIQQARLFHRIQQMAITDDLTGVFNRRHFFDLAQREYERVQRYGGQLSAIMLDLDNFKEVNDTYGHSTGDEVLRAVAQWLDNNIRETDILGRYGGDEFAILLPATDFVAAHQLAARLRHGLVDSPILTERGAFQVSMTLGVASLDDDVSSVGMLIDLADADMYATKQAE